MDGTSMKTVIWKKNTNNTHLYGRSWTRFEKKDTVCRPRSQM